MPKVSVLVPVYNVEQYLEQCLDSILAQTLENIEVICVNDGSTDGSGEILQRYAEKDNRIVIVNKKNGGLPSARNAGIRSATGEYVSFIDADDYIEPNMLEKMYNTAKRDNSEIVICGANVFPRDPAPEGWLDWVLSPENAYYETGNEKLLFENHASRPFIWRTFMKRELLTRENFQLDESIHVGEDNAFQFRIYPKAKGITLISDKLYNYRWYREDSLMNSIVYKDVEKKSAAHIKMVLHVAQEWERSGDMDKMGKAFLGWSAEFLYDDFIKTPLAARIENAKRLIELWTRLDFYRYEYCYPDYVQDMFKYFFAVSKEENIRPEVSVVICTDKDYLYLENTLKSCFGQSFRKLELIIINNGSGSGTYLVIHKYLHKDKRVRVYNTQKSSVADGYNIALRMCKGRYVLFMRPNDRFADDNTLAEWVRFASSNKAQVVVSPICSEDSEACPPTVTMGDQFDCELGNAIFDSELAKKNLFIDHSTETGKMFLASAWINAKHTAVIDRPMYIKRNVFVPDWLPAKECASLVRSFADRLELAEKYGNDELYSKVFSLVESDRYMNMLVNSTRPYFMPLNESSNGENSQYEVWEQLARLLALIDPGKQGVSTLPPIFAKFVNGRHSYIGEISDGYLKV